MSVSISANIKNILSRDFLIKYGTYAKVIVIGQTIGGGADIFTKSDRGRITILCDTKITRIGWIY